MHAEGLNRLRRCLIEGVSHSSDGVDVRAELRISPDAADRDVARSLVQILDAVEVASLDLAVERGHDRRRTEETAPVATADSSFLGRLGGGGDDGIGVDEVRDVGTLVAVLRAGHLRQRRAALQRLAEQLGKAGRVAPAAVKEAEAALEATRDVELAYERTLVHAKMPGAPGRAARAEADQWRRLVDRLLPRVRAFWDGEVREEPVAELPGEERALLLLRAPELPDEFISHLGAVIEGSAGNVGAEERLAVLSSLRHSADARLVASLVWTLEVGTPELAVEAARTLCRVDDPRVRSVLLAAYERSVVDPQRAVLAGALASTGDHRGLDYVKGLLGSDDPATLLAALEAMETLGTAEDCERVTSFLGDANPTLVAQTVRTLARMGDKRALPMLAELGRDATVSSLRAEVEDAISAIQARRVLLGEDIHSTMAMPLPEPVADPPLLRIPALERFRAYYLYFVGRAWISIGGFRRGVARLEQAAAARADWTAPLLSIAMACTRRQRYAQALSVFRRAIDIGRRRVERNPVVLRALAQTFLERSEELEAEGRREVARGLVNEALSLDLRRAPSALRFELERRRRTLRRSLP